MQWKLACVSHLIISAMPAQSSAIYIYIEPIVDIRDFVGAFLHSVMKPMSRDGLYMIPNRS